MNLNRKTNEYQEHYWKFIHTVYCDDSVHWRCENLGGSCLSPEPKQNLNKTLNVYFMHVHRATPVTAFSSINKPRYTIKRKHLSESVSSGCLYSSGDETGGMGVGDRLRWASPGWYYKAARCLQVSPPLWHPRPPWRHLPPSRWWCSYAWYLLRVLV